jgi:type I restriction enzyme, S subunit
MQDSGVPWMGRVPAHWTRSKLRHLLDRVAERNRPDLPLLSVVREKGVILRDISNSEDNHNFIPDDLSNYKVVRRGQFAMNKMKAWQGSYGVSNHDGIVSPAYFVFNLRGAEGRFFHLAIRSRAYVPSFTQASDGVRIGQWDLSEPRMREIPFFVPPLPEQASIVRFLDHADRRIGRYIRSKQKLITLLEEQKQAIIHRAVTHGLDPRVRLKPSGLKWLRNVPAHWDVSPAKYFFREMDERSETGAEELLSVSHITGVTPRSQKNITMFLAESNVGHKICRPGDLVINTMWAWMAALGIASQTGIVSPSYAVYRPRSSTRLLGEYADLLLRTTPYKSEYLCRSTGIRLSRLRLYPEQFLKIKILCPPVEEQFAIVDSVGKDTSDARRAIDLASREIALLRDYRTRLIADVVTGKLDVGEAAAGLPEDVEEAEASEVVDGEPDAEVTELDPAGEEDEV